MDGHQKNRFSCSECGKEFAEEAALKQHLQAKHAGAAPKAPAGEGFKLPPLKLILAVVVVAGLALGVAWLASLPKAERLPGYQDHWHAGFEVKICGERQPDFAYSPGGVHTHGDGKIHVHPHAPDELGALANLRKYFQSVNLEVAAGSVKFPDGRSFKDGAACPDGKPGSLKVFVNGQQKVEFLSYVVQDGDFVRVEFGP